MNDRIDERSEAFAKDKLARIEELKSIRSTREPELQMICDYVFPRRDFTISKEPHSIRTRKLMDTTAIISHERLAATLYGYMLSPHTPFAQPKLLSRDPTWEEDAWFDHVTRRMHAFYSSADNRFRMSMAEDVLDITGFGSSVMWQDDSLVGPMHLAVPFRQCYWDQDENNVIDTNYREYEMTLRRAYRRWPDSPGLKQLMAQTDAPESRMLTIIHVVEPREGGRAGLPRLGLPWRDVSILQEKMEVLEVGGHSRFKYNIGRFQTRPGDALGYGAPFKVLPTIKVVSAATEAIIRAAEKQADPVLGTYLPRGTTIDRRPGQVNFLNSLAGVHLRDPRNLLFPVEQGGNPGIAIEMVTRWQSQIEMGMYVDWLTPGEGPQKTATEVYDLRDLRLRTMGPMVARLEHEKLNKLVETDFEILQRRNFFLPPPASLANEEIGFIFKGPLATAQQQGEMEGIMKTIEAGGQLAGIDPDVMMLFESEKTMRRIANINGMDGSLLASPKVFEERREAQRQTGEMQEEMAAATAAAQAMRDGAQGLASLQAAGAA